MADVKLDPEKKFKWISYTPSTSLSAVDDNRLRQFAQTNYTGLLDVTLNSLNLPVCSGKIKMLTTLAVGTKLTTNNPLFGVYKVRDVQTALAKSTIPESQKDTIEQLYSDVMIRLDLAVDIDNIKQKFRECASSNLFVISLSTVPLRHLLPEETVYVTHANILVIAKNRGTVYWIEPQTTVNPAYENLMIQSIKNLVTDIGMVDPTVINPVEVCPQAITGDTNCMFWAYAIFSLLMLNPQERDHNVLIKNFMEKYPTKEALEEYINGLKSKLLQSLPGNRGGKKRSTRRRIINKRRKTYHRRK